MLCESRTKSILFSFSSSSFIHFCVFPFHMVCFYSLLYVLMFSLSLLSSPCFVHFHFICSGLLYPPLSSPSSSSSLSSCPSLNLVELLFPPSLPSLLQSTCDTLRSHSDSLGFTPNVLPRHPTLGNFEEFAC